MWNSGHCEDSVASGTTPSALERSVNVSVPFAIGSPLPIFLVNSVGNTWVQKGLK